MCWKNYTQKSGCGHYGPVVKGPYTLCPIAQQALLDHRGPTSPLSSAFSPLNPPLKRSSTSSAFAKRFFSASLSRANTTSSFTSRRSVSGPPDANSPRTSTSSSPFASNTRPELDVTPGMNITDHEMKEILCEEPERRMRVGSGGEMQICTVCRKSIEDMRFMIERFEKSGSIRGTTAFDEFLRLRGDAVGGKDVYG